MKKLLLTVSIACVLVLALGCSDWQSTVKNDSNYQISFKWSNNQTETITLNTGESTSVNVSNTGIVSLEPSKRVTFNWVDDTIHIINIPSYEVRVENKTIRVLTLRARDEWMENDIVDIPPGDFLNGNNYTGRVYTKAPIFFVETNDIFPVTINYVIKDDICYVQIL